MEPTEHDEYRGPVRVVSGQGDLGEIRVVLTTAVDERVAAGWGGRVLNSDYLLWGAAGNEVDLVFDDGRRVAVAIHASGRITGRGPSPWDRSTSAQDPPEPGPGP